MTPANAYPGGDGPPPEWSVPVNADTIDHHARPLALAADAAARAALVARFDLTALDRLDATVALVRTAARIDATGELRATGAQRCVVTGEAVPFDLVAPVQLRFVPASATADSAEEIELDADDLDTIDYEGNAFDLGEALADTFYLALDPYPRGPSAEKALRAAGVMTEAEAGPFGALSALLKKD